MAGHAPLFDHYEYAFRDWGWGAHGDRENGIAADLVADAAGDRAPERILVLGAGAGRLAYDLHHRLRASTTLALDVNPFLSAVARRMALGDELVLAEFAVNHAAVERAVALRRLSAPAPARPGLDVVIADATRPPVRQGAFDSVVAPWFFDQLHRDTRDVLPGIHGALAEGGRLVVYGPLLHPRGKPLVRCHDESELVELLGRGGFEVVSRRTLVVPYLHAPEGSARHEPVVVVAAERGAGTRGSLPAWLRGIDIPIPRRTALEPRRGRDPAAVAIASLVDGRRSVLAIASLLARCGGLDPRRALDAAIDGLLALLRDAEG